MPSKLVLFDAGEGTLGQLARVYGSGLNSALTDLHTIFISHMHADHHLGLFSIIRAWAGVNNGKRLNVIGPSMLRTWMHDFDPIQDISLEKIDFFDNQDLKDIASVNGMKVQTVSVNHCAKAYAVVMYIDEFKFAFSGDCRPSTDFEMIGQHCDLLIHESTFEDLQSAVMKKHCTMNEAIKVGRK